MNDLEHDLRALLDEKAAGAGAPMPDPRLVRRARRRQLGAAVGGVLVVAALLCGVAVAMATLGGPDRRTPADPLALAGEGAQPWPADLVPLDPGNLGENEIEPSGCYPDWTFLRASWTEGGRTFEARVGLGPDVSEADR